MAVDEDPMVNLNLKKTMLSHAKNLIESSCNNNLYTLKTFFVVATFEGL